MFVTTGLSPSMVQDSAASSSTFPLLSIQAPSAGGLDRVLKILVFPLHLFTGLGCSRFARRYYGNRFCFLFLQLLRCFNSPGCLYPTYEFIGSS
jgi:hypothetical protein